MLNKYLKKYNGIKILVYSESQKGILDIIKKVVVPENIIYVGKKKKYIIKKAIYIKNKYHIMTTEEPINKYIHSIISKFIISESKLTAIYLNIAIIKNNNSENITSDGVIDFDIAQTFSKNKNYYLLEPQNYSEEILINIIYNCKNIILSFGTSFFKNICYVSESCETVEIIVIHNSVYLEQFNYTKKCNDILTKIKNAKIIYNLYDKNLTLIKSLL